jgi:hypothetical protein
MIKIGDFILIYIYPITDREIVLSKDSSSSPDLLKEKKCFCSLFCLKRARLRSLK